MPSATHLAFQLCFSLCCTCVFAVKLADLEQGAKFDKCVSKSDWFNATIDDDITLVDRTATGCCPEGTLPGVKIDVSYTGAQIVCGIKSDGSIAFTETTDTCEYNTCYVWKQNLPCTDGKQHLNGCCEAPEKCAASACGFKDKCINYAAKSTSNSVITALSCKTYNQKYTGGSAVKDFQTDGKLDVSKMTFYTPCEGGAGGGSGSGGVGSGGGGSGTAAGTTAKTAAEIAAEVAAALNNNTAAPKSSTSDAMALSIGISVPLGIFAALLN